MYLNQKSSPSVINSVLHPKVKKEQMRLQFSFQFHPKTPHLPPQLRLHLLMEKKQHYSQIVVVQREMNSQHHPLQSHHIRLCKSRSRHLHTSFVTLPSVLLATFLGVNISLRMHSFLLCESKGASQTFHVFVSDYRLNWLGFAMADDSPNVSSSGVISEGRQHRHVILVWMDWLFVWIQAQCFSSQGFPDCHIYVQLAQARIVLTKLHTNAPRLRLSV